MGKDHFGQSFDTLQLVRRIGKDDVEGTGLGLEVSEDIFFNRGEVVYVQLIHHLADKTEVLAGFFHSRYMATTPGYQFKGYVACSGKEIQGRKAVEIQLVFQYVEKVFLGKVGGRPCLDIFRRMEDPAFIFSTDYTQRLKRKRLVNCRADSLLKV